jgi:hypothetical protein
LRGCFGATRRDGWTNTPRQTPKHRLRAALLTWPPLQTAVYVRYVQLYTLVVPPGHEDGAIVSRSVFDRKFRIKAVQSCHSDRYCSGKRPLCSGKLGRTQGGIPRRQQPARQRHSHRGRGTGGHTRPPGCATRPLAHPSASVTAAYPGPPHRIRTFRPNAALFRSNGVVSAPMRTREVIETNRYPFRLNAERDTHNPMRLASTLPRRYTDLDFSPRPVRVSAAGASDVYPSSQSPSERRSGLPWPALPFYRYGMPFSIGRTR